ncbi:hypothetical protein Smp_138320 [Schistosoma mansoni]|uniref:hypothetical protein n=1 Tax=Schistosoma mansoni TaxID=6183 RepID=UPI00022DC18A|nr:hypothetical protein Smp_138320 [Schistosoma mansoni]|eukprot:XP_018651304.1 hypothetical protein Smp_138320 [Schistosoma mansoni]
MASVGRGDVGDIDALLRAAEILEKKMYSKDGYGTADTLRNINVAQFLEWLSTCHEADSNVSMDSKISPTMHVELANLIQMSGCQKISELQTVFGSARKLFTTKSTPLSYSDGDPVFTYHPDVWNQCPASHLRPDSASSKLPQSHCRVLTAATGVTQLSEPFPVGGIGTTDEPDGLSNTSDDVCMDSSSQDSYSGNTAPVRANTNVMHILNTSLGSEFNGHVDPGNNKSQYSNCRLRSALLTPYSPGSEIHSTNSVRHLNHFLNKDISTSNIPLQQRPVTESIQPEIFPNSNSSQRLLEVLSRTYENYDDLDQRNSKFRASESPQRTPTVHQQTSWSAPPSVSSSSCATPDKECCDAINQIEIPQPVRPTRFSCSSLPVKKRKLDWKQSDNWLYDLQSSDKHLCKFKKTPNVNPSDLVSTTGFMTTSSHDNPTYCSSSGSIPERRKSVSGISVSDNTQQSVTSKITIPLLRTCSVPVNSEQRMIHSPKLLDTLTFSKHLIEEKKSLIKTPYQNHFSVLTRTLTGSDNIKNHINSSKQYASELTTMSNGSNVSKLSKDSIFNMSDNKKRKKPITADLLFRSPHNTHKHRSHAHNNNENSNNQLALSDGSDNIHNRNEIFDHTNGVHQHHCFSKLQTARTVEMNVSNFDHNNNSSNNKLNGSTPVVERKHNGLIQTIPHNEHNNTVSHQLSHTLKEDTVYDFNSICQKQSNNSDNSNDITSGQDRNNLVNNYQQLSSIISQSTMLPNHAVTTTSTPTTVTNVISHNLNTYIITSSSSLSNVQQSSPNYNNNNNSKIIPHPSNFPQTYTTPAITTSNFVNSSSGTSSFPLLLISASSSASAVALAEAAALATGVPSTSFVPVPVQVTTYVPPPSSTTITTTRPIKNEEHNDKLKIQFQRKIPFVLSAPSLHPNFNNIQNDRKSIINGKQHHSTPVLKDISSTNTSDDHVYDSKLTHQAV